MRVTERTRGQASLRLMVKGAVAATLAIILAAAPSSAGVDGVDGASARRAAAPPRFEVVQVVELDTRRGVADVTISALCMGAPRDLQLRAWLDQEGGEPGSNKPYGTEAFRCGRVNLLTLKVTGTHVLRTGHAYFHLVWGERCDDSGCGPHGGALYSVVLLDRARVR